MQIQILQNIIHDFLAEPGSKESKKAEKDLLSLRHEAFAEQMFGLLNLPEFASHQATLLRICWENGSDFSAFSLPLIDFVKYSSWPVAIEASSVIESMRPDRFSADKKEQDLNHILNGFEKLDDQRKAFTGRLIELYENAEESAF